MIDGTIQTTVTGKLRVSRYASNKRNAQRVHGWMMVAGGRRITAVRQKDGSYLVKSLMTTTELAEFASHEAHFECRKP